MVVAQEVEQFKAINIALESVEEAEAVIDVLEDYCNVQHCEDCRFNIAGSNICHLSDDLRFFVAKEADSGR